MVTQGEPLNLYRANKLFWYITWWWAAHVLMLSHSWRLSERCCHVCVLCHSHFFFLNILLVFHRGPALVITPSAKWYLWGGWIWKLEFVVIVENNYFCVKNQQLYSEFEGSKKWVAVNTLKRLFCTSHNHGTPPEKGPKSRWISELCVLSVFFFFFVHIFPSAAHLSCNCLWLYVALLSVNTFHVALLSGIVNMCSMPEK